MELKSSILLFVILSSITLVLCGETMKIDIVDRPKECTKKAKAGDKISMHYDGVLSTGKPFDSSRSRNSPFTFKLGVKQVISCWDQGIPGMCVGEKRKLTCPPDYAYGDRGFGDIIPAKSTLVFDVELLEILESTPETKETKKETKKEAPKEAKKEVKEDDHDHDHDHGHTDTFESVDKDKNGEISREEMTDYIKRYQAEEPEEEAPSDEEMENLISEIFQADDTNKDGVLSKDEYYHGEGEFPTDDEDLAKEMELGENEFKDEL